eukprot:1160956-Pelagomonas_calceolata.AAC.6
MGKGAEGGGNLRIGIHAEKCFNAIHGDGSLENKFAAIPWREGQREGETHRDRSEHSRLDKHK